MALPSNKSSSPSMVAGRTSPNSRNSEISNPIRRSFSGNPFSKPSIVANPRSLNPITPANSPSDYPRRSRENLFTSRDNEEKENGKDQSPKPVRVRSPTVGKSTKHFMSPTISAASKIAVSPKKKILGDRNEPVRSSLSFSGMKSSSLNSVNPNSEASTALESDTNPQIAPISNPKSSKSVRFGGVEVISGSYDDSEFTHRYDPEVVTMAVETDTKPETALISESAMAAPPPKSSATVKFGGFEVISDSYDDSESTYRNDTNSDIVTMAVEADTMPEIAPISAIAAAPPKASKTVRFADVEVISISNNDLVSPVKNNFTEELDSVNLDPSFKLSPVSSPMEVAPLDADPLMPPYDPKTNYLSPRPQFLHYRPNQRINRYEPDGRLEELFASANVSESEFTEETDSEDPQMESDEASSSESQMEEKEEEEEEEEIINVSEQSPIEAKKSSKLQISRIFKISSLLLILFTACFSICVVNVHDPNIFERARLLTLEDPSEIYEFAMTNFNVLVGKLEVWHANSKSFISDMVFNIRGGRTLIYLNQTEFFNKDVIAVGQCLVLSRQTLWEEENNLSVMEEAMKDTEIDIVEEHTEREDQNEVQEREEESLREIEAMKEREFDIDPVEREAQSEKVEEEEPLEETEAMKEREIDIDPVEGEAQKEEVEEESIEASAKSAYEISLQEIVEEKLDELVEVEEDVQEKQTEENYEVSSSPYSKIHDQIEPEAGTGRNERTIQQSNTEFQYQSPPVSPPSEPQSDVEDNSGNIDLIGAATENGISRDFKQNTAIIVSAILLGLSLIAGLIYARKSGSGSGSRPSTAGAAIVEKREEQPPLLKEKRTNQSPAEEAEEIGDDDRDDDMAGGESCSSEMSSFQYSGTKGGETEATKRSSEEARSHSHGRKTMRRNSRRESMASSSLEEYSVSTSASPSYGSFTTYEKIPIKHGSGDEEIVTPVRRSSRIRKATQQ